MRVSRDPDQTQDPYACRWRCEVESGGTGFCYSATERGKLIFASISGCDTTVESIQFEAGKSYKIMYVLKQERIDPLHGSASFNALILGNLSTDDGDAGDDA